MLIYIIIIIIIIIIIVIIISLTTCHYDLHPLKLHLAIFYLGSCCC